MNSLYCYASAKRLSNDPYASVIGHFKPVKEFFARKLRKVIACKAVHMLFKASDSFHERTFKISANAHYLTCCLHLCGKSSLRCKELVKRKPGDLYYTVVKCRLKRCIGLACNCILYLIKCVTKCDLCRNLGDRISRRL